MAVTIPFTVVGAAATVDLVLSTSSLVFPSCLKPLEVRLPSLQTLDPA